MKVKRLLMWVTLSLIGLFGVSQILKFSLLYEAQKQALNQAVALLSEDEQEQNYSSVDELKIKQKQIQETIARLNQTPQLPGFDYDQAQANLAALLPLDISVTRQIQIEENAAASLEQARQLYQDAIEIIKSQPNTLETWHVIKEKWQAAISFLEKVPTNTKVYSQVQTLLVSVQNEYKVASQNIDIEEKAIKHIITAMEIAERANSLTIEKPYKMGNLVNAKVQWIRAINELRLVFGSTETANDASRFIQYYQHNLQKTDTAITQLKECLGEAYRINVSCGYTVSLNIEMPQVKANSNNPNIGRSDNSEQINDDEVADVESPVSVPQTIAPVIVRSPYYRRYRSNSANNFSRGSTNVRDYTRSNGTRVQGYTRGSQRSSGFGSARFGGSSA